MPEMIVAEWSGDNFGINSRRNNTKVFMDKALMKKVRVTG